MEKGEIDLERCRMNFTKLSILQPHFIPDDDLGLKICHSCDQVD